MGRIESAIAGVCREDALAKEYLENDELVNVRRRQRC